MRTTLPESDQSVVKLPAGRKAAKQNIEGVSVRHIKATLKATSSLTDEDFESWLHDNYFRLALYTLAQMACGGDIRALEAYLKRADAHRTARANPIPVSPSGMTFLPARATGADQEAD